MVTTHGDVLSESFVSDRDITVHLPPAFVTKVICKIFTLTDSFMIGMKERI